MRTVLAGVGCALLLMACGSSVSAPEPSSTPTNGAAGTPAASLRVHLDLLLTEHVFAIAKLAVAAAAGRSDEYRSYAGLLATNGGDLEALFRTALGETAGGRVGDAWAEQNNSLVDYVVAAVTHDLTGTGAAMSKLTGTYVTDMARVLVSSLSLSADAATTLALSHVTAVKTVVDDVVAAAYPQLFQDLSAARVQAVTFGDTIAIQVAQQFADRFPGDPVAAGAAFRTNFNSLVQQQGYLMTMASDAAAGGQDAEAAAAVSALSAGADALSQMSGGTVWTDSAPMVVTYAKTGDAGARTSILGSAAAANLTDAFTAMLRVIDDQRAKSFTAVATDDRAMAAALATAADEVSLSRPD